MDMIQFRDRLKHIALNADQKQLFTELISMAEIAARNLSTLEVIEKADNHRRCEAVSPGGWKCELSYGHPGDHSFTLWVSSSDTPEEDTPEYTPPPPTPQETIAIDIRVPKDLLEFYNNVAKMCGASIGDVINVVLAMRLEGAKK